MPIDLSEFFVKTEQHGTTTADLAIRDLVAAPGFSPKSWQSAAPESAYESSKLPVQDSEDLRRIKDLPRRAVVTKDSPDAKRLVQLMTRRYSRNVAKGACNCAAVRERWNIANDCITELNLAQSWALFEIGHANGLLGPIGTGHGKSILSLMAPLAFGNVAKGFAPCRTAVLLCPVGLLAQLVGEYECLGEHFRVPNLIVHGKIKVTATDTLGRETSAEREYREIYKTNPATGEPEPVLHVFPYSKLSLPKSSAKLEEIAPDVILSDEVQNLRHPATARTARVLRYFVNHESTRFAGWSGSLTDASLKDFAHLAALALREWSPLPCDPDTVDDWARALDPKFAKDDPKNPWSMAAPPGALLMLDDGRGGHISEVFHRRFVETLGVTPTTSPSVDAELVIAEQIPKSAVPPSISEALKTLRDTWCRPDGEELIDAMSVARTARELAAGFHYYWHFPKVNGAPQQTSTILEWLELRALYRKWVRGTLTNRREYLDSPMLVEQAVKRAAGDLAIPACPGNLTREEWARRHPAIKCQVWPAWRDIRKAVVYETRAMRIDEYLARDASEWAKENRGIVWYESAEFGQWVSELSGLTRHGGGPDAARLIRKEKGDVSIICSIKAHGTGRDGLQFLYNDQLIAQPPSSPTMWEQCLDDDTEVLTRDGWRGIDADWLNAEAAAYDITTGTIEWSAAEYVSRPLGDETMYGIESRHTDIRVTAGHRMVVERSHHASRHVVTYRPREFATADAMPRIGRIPVAGRQDAPGVSLTDDELTFLGLFLTDGNHDPSNNTIALFQSENYPDIIAEIERVIKSCGFHARHSVNTKPSQFGPRSPLHKWVISYTTSTPGKRGWSHLEAYVDKAFAPGFEQLNREQLRILLHGMWLGDGSKTAGTYAYSATKRWHTYPIATRRAAVADRIQSLCVRRGMRCNVTTRPDGLRMMLIGFDVDTWSLQTTASDTRPTWGVVPSSPDERVWCVRVSTGAIVTRRRGKVAIAGNCLSRLHRAKQPCPIVYARFYRHTKELRDHVDKALARALYVQATLGAAQRLRSGFVEADAIATEGAGLDLSTLLLDAEAPDPSTAMMHCGHEYGSGECHDCA